MLENYKELSEWDRYKMFCDMCEDICKDPAEVKQFASLYLKTIRLCGVSPSYKATNTQNNS